MEREDILAGAMAETGKARLEPDVAIMRGVVVFVWKGRCDVLIRSGPNGGGDK